MKLGGLVRVTRLPVSAARNADAPSSSSICECPCLWSKVWDGMCKKTHKIAATPAAQHTINTESENGQRGTAQAQCFGELSAVMVVGRTPWRWCQCSWSLKAQTDSVERTKWSTTFLAREILSTPHVFSKAGRRLRPTEVVWVFDRGHRDQLRDTMLQLLGAVSKITDAAVAWSLQPQRTF
jgi:hypothetical protein